MEGLGEEVRFHGSSLNTALQYDASPIEIQTLFLHK